MKTFTEAIVKGHISKKIDDMFTIEEFEKSSIKKLINYKDIQISIYGYMFSEDIKRLQIGYDELTKILKKCNSKINWKYILVDFSFVNKITIYFYNDFDTMAGPLVIYDKKENSYTYYAEADSFSNNFKEVSYDKFIEFLKK